MGQNLYQPIFLRGKIVGICEAVICEEIGIIAAARRLWRLGIELGADDSNFEVFVAIDSETDHLPVDIERQNWSSEALQAKDAEILEYGKRYKSEVINACKNLINLLELKD